MADAVNSTLASHSADLVLSGSGGAVGSNLTITGTGSIDFDQNAMQIAVNVSSGTQRITEQVIDLGKVIYLNLGSQIGQILPGKSWISLDLSQLSPGGAVKSLGNDTLTNDPAAALQALRQEGNTATDLGPSTINGVSVEGYSVHIDAAAMKKELAQDDLPSWMRQAVKNVSNPNVVYKVYIESSGLLVAMTSEVTETVSGQSVSVGTTLDFAHYGATVNVVAPPAGEVATFESFLQAAESLSSPPTSTN